MHAEKTTQVVKPFDPLQFDATDACESWQRFEQEQAADGTCQIASFFSNDVAAFVFLLIPVLKVSCGLNDTGGGQQGAGDSAEAARAARITTLTLIPIHKLGGFLGCPIVP